MRILTIDIETAPTAAYVWGMWDQNVAMNQIIKPGYILSYAAKWLDEDLAIFDAIWKGPKKRFLDNLHKLLSEADAIITYNGKKFDVPTVNREFILAGLLPPSNYKHIDLLPIVRKHFKFPHNKLDYVAQALGVGAKLKHAGFEMWLGVMAGNKESQNQMKDYNIEDVFITEGVYYKVRPWINNHPNVGLHDDKPHVCPTCGGAHLQRRGFAFTAAGKYQRFQCNACGSWSRNKKTEAVKEINAAQ
jgi:hypothetical protein